MRGTPVQYLSYHKQSQYLYRFVVVCTLQTTSIKAMNIYILLYVVWNVNLFFLVVRIVWVNVRFCHLEVVVRQELVAPHWVLSEHSNFGSRRPRISNPQRQHRPAPTSSFLHHPKPQSCLTEKSRSRTHPGMPCSPRRSPTRLAASSCSTRHVHRESSSCTPF